MRVLLIKYIRTFTWHGDLVAGVDVKGLDCAVIAVNGRAQDDAGEPVEHEYSLNHGT
jgi:hypothetical protein